MTVTDPSTGSRPPAWHPDPSGRHQHRWWDGEAWTDQVRDGDSIAQDPPVATPVVDEAPVGYEPFGSGEAEPEVEEEESVSTDPDSMMAEKKRLPPELRPTTAPGSDEDPTVARKRIVVAALGGVVVLAALFWGWHNWSSANEWRDRAAVVQHRLDDRESNYAALERSLGAAASRGANAADSQQVMVEMGDTLDMVLNQIQSCAGTLDDMIGLIGTTDVGTLARRAQDACGAALYNAQILGGMLDQLTGDA